MSSKSVPMRVNTGSPCRFSKHETLGFFGQISTKILNIFLASKSIKMSSDRSRQDTYKGLLPLTSFWFSMKIYYL